MVDQVLIHHGIKGMRWGVRRYQNPDGSLTEAGKARYKIGSDGKLQKLSRSERGSNGGQKQSLSNTAPTRRERARHIIEDPISSDEIHRSKDSEAVKKHVTFDKNGKVIGISEELERYFGVPLSEIDDMDFVVYQAMILEALKGYE